VLGKLFGADLDPADLDALLSEFHVTSHAAGSILTRMGDRVEALFAVLDGTVNLIFEYDGQTHISLLSPGDTYREISLFSDDPSSASFQAVSDCVIAALPRASFEEFCESRPLAGIYLNQIVGERLRHRMVTAALHASELFGGLGSAALQEIEKHLRPITLNSGECLCREGDPSDGLWFVIRGRLRVQTRRADGSLYENTVGGGETVGEMGVISDQPRNADIHALRDTHLAFLSRSSFDALLQRHPRPTVELVVGQTAARIRQLTLGVSSSVEAVNTIAVLPASPGAPLAEFCAGLAQALAAYGPTTHLSSEAVDRHLGTPGIAQAWEQDGRGMRLVEWLSRQELTHKFAVYQADPRLTPWTDRCLRQADRVLFVADLDGDATPGEMETLALPGFIARGGHPPFLVLLRPASQAQPSGTRRWLTARPFQRHFHVQHGQNADYGRLARHLTGRAIGLALGGGFARGLAHIGVFRAMAELGLEVDAVGGSSMGAVVGAMSVLGWPESRITTDLCEGCSKSFDDLTFPFLAFKSGGKFSALIRHFFEDTQIEDLTVPYFCLSANLNHASIHIHTRGQLAKAILASTRAPGIFPPIVYEGELHVDGGVLNNVPVDLMKDFVTGGMVFGVDVSPPHELQVIEDYGENVSGWRAFWQRFSPWAKQRTYTPSILLVMMRTIEFGGVSYKNARLEMADIYMRPPMLGFKRTDFHSAAAIADTGYQTAKADIAQWLQGRAAVLAIKRPDILAASVAVSGQVAG